LDIRKLQYFLSIVDNSSFSAAADELYISQSSLSKQIIALEKELGFPVFDRSRRQISLTSAGKTFLEHARTLNRDYQCMMAELGEHKIVPYFSILAIPVIAQYGIPAYLAAFKESYPEIQFGLEEREAVSILSSLDNHQHDLAFIRDNYLDAALYSSHEIASDKLVAVVSKDHRFAKQHSVSLTELSNENFILFDKGTVVHEITVDACRKAGFEPRIFYASLRVESILGLVSSNSGISLMMEKIFNFHKPPSVIGIPLRETIESNLVLAWLKNKRLSQPARIFIEFMRRKRSW
jgi:LysR family transcriptional regulator, transcription activator of glutamate synthase operon